MKPCPPGTGYFSRHARMIIIGRRSGPGRRSPPWKESVLTGVPAVSVVIPAYNAGATLERCLDSLKCQTEKPLEIILVDDCSADRTPMIASTRDIHVVSFKERMGPARARNRGAEQAAGDVVLFVDSDVVVPPDLVERIVSLFASDAAIAAVQTLYSPVCPAEGLVSRYQNFYYFHALHRMKSSSTATFATWCAAVRKEVFLESGGFNVSIPEPTVEDEELGYEIADRGDRIFLARDLQVTHLASYTLGQFASRRLRMARAQAKSGWRSVRDRLLRRYINIRETGTHHSRYVVLSIVLVMLSLLCMTAAAASFAFGSDLWKLFLTTSAGAMVLSQLCHLGFFGSALSFFGPGALPGFILLCVFDMAVLGWGILQGTVQFVTGRRY